MNRTILRQLFAAALGFFALLFLWWTGLRVWGVWHDEWSGYNASTTVSDGYCNIAVVPLLGEIVPYAGIYEDGSGNALPPSINPKDTLAALHMAEDDPNILGIFVQIDSGGGTAVTAKIIADELKRSPLPIVALIGEMGASAAYLAATGAEMIIASPFSNIGSIGVTMSYLENTAKNTKDGLRYIPLASAPFKDYGNPAKPLTPSERKLIERDLKIYHEQFVKEVAENRNLPLEQVAKIADGSSLPGTLALKNKLIDQLGDQESARAWFAEQLKMPVEEVMFCE